MMGANGIIEVMTRKARHWCGDKVGRSHQPVVSLPSPGSTHCYAHAWWNLEDPVWSCWHVQLCTRCGKHLNKLVRCPEMPEGMLQLGIDWPFDHG
jgi:hypothetical protein